MSKFILFFDVHAKMRYILPAKSYNLRGGEPTMANGGLRYLATRSRAVYERMILVHFEEEFAKQQQVQAIKASILAGVFLLLATFAIAFPFNLSRYLLAILI